MFIMTSGQVDQRRWWRRILRGFSVVLGILGALFACAYPEMVIIHTQYMLDGLDIRYTRNSALEVYQTNSHFTQKFYTKKNLHR